MIKQIHNNHAFSSALFDYIVRSDLIPIFDLDEVLLDAKHRQKLFTLADVIAGNCSRDQVGHLDLEHYRDNTQAHLVEQDKNLPLQWTIHMLNMRNVPYHVSTARVACEHTTKLLKARCIEPDRLMSRNGEFDNRRDNVLKRDNLVHHFSPKQRKDLFLIDDSLANCETLAGLTGNDSIHVIPSVEPIEESILWI